MLWFQLALRLGSTVSHLKKTMSLREFAYWRVFNSMQPIGDIRNDYNSARISYTQVTSQGAKNVNFQDFVNFPIKTKEDIYIDNMTEIERTFYQAAKK